MLNPGIEKPDNSFDIFLGYSISKVGTETLNNREFKEFILNKMKTDLLDSIVFMKETIDDLGLSDYSFYIYALPLFNVEKDESNIISNSFGGD